MKPEPMRLVQDVSAFSLKGYQRIQLCSLHNEIIHSHNCFIELTHESLLVHTAFDHVRTQEAFLRVKIARHCHCLPSQGALPLIVLDVLLVPVKGRLVREHAHVACVSDETCGVF